MIIVLITSILAWTGLISEAERSTLVVLATGATSMYVLLRVSLPFNAYRGVLFGLMFSLFIAAILVIPGLFYLTPFTTAMWIILPILLGILFLCFWFFTKVADRIAGWISKRHSDLDGNQSKVLNIFHKG